MLDVSPFQGWDGWICCLFRAVFLLENLLLMKRILFSVALGAVLALGFNAWKDGITNQLSANPLPASDTFEIASDTTSEVALQRALIQQFEAHNQEKPTGCRLPSYIQYAPGCGDDSEMKLEEPLLYLDEEVSVSNPEAALSTADSLKDTIYEIFDLSVLPQYPGGEVELLKYLRDNIQFKEPDCTPRKGVFGFVVKKNGDLSNFEVLRDPGCGLGETYIEFLKKMPKWIPGSFNGTTVDAKYMIPIQIRIE
jgi:periplasmic protein TonB